jgi:hypothetical protein
MPNTFDSIYQPMFTCPRCGGHYFKTDTSSEDREDWTVHCNGSSTVPVISCGWTGKHTQHVKPVPAAQLIAEADRAQLNAMGVAAWEKWGHEVKIEGWQCGCGYMNYNTHECCGDCGTHKDHQ